MYYPVSDLIELLYNDIVSVQAPGSDDNAAYFNCDWRELVFKQTHNGVSVMQLARIASGLMY